MGRKSYPLRRQTKAGITVAQTRIIALEGANALAIRRFDREGDHRIHSISAGTAIRASTPARVFKNSYVGRTDKIPP
ncbi:MAG: HipA domain-containing protein [Alcaligenaceae bacterium]|nr:HipA domain-containing protein [Alcaligenaceae bacterium]